MIADLVEPRTRAVGNGRVRRVLPHRSRPMVGPFIFADLIGPDTLPAGTGVDIDAHPHIGLSTLTYLFEGAMLHRDSTGAVQRIEPGAVNWMTAGAGVCHTERTPEDLRQVESRQAGLQTWVALPGEHEDDDPSFQHNGAPSIPEARIGSSTVRLVAGEGWGLTSPVAVSSPLVLAELHLAGDAMPLEVALPEVAVLAVEGELHLGRQRIAPGQLAVLDGADGHRLTGRGHAMVLGGEPLGQRLISWNFVASHRGRIEAARADWQAQRFPRVPGDHEPWVPLPDV